MAASQLQGKLTMTYLFWKGILILALGQPAVLKPAGNVLWISNKDFIKVQSQPGQTTLFPVQKGKVFLSGFRLNGADLNTAIITSSANLLALNRCKGRQDFEQSPSLSNSFEFIGSELNSKNFENLLNCGFDDLKLSKNKIKFFEKYFLMAEKNLIRSGIKTGLASWQDGKRNLIVYSSLSEEKIKERIPENIRAFYNLEFRAKSTPGKNLIFELTMFEFSRQRARSLGLKWPKSVSLISIDQMGRYKSTLQDVTGGAAKNILLSADFGESQGVGRVLAQPTLRTQPGLESKFLSGGEFPVKNSNAFQSQTTWKSYGLKIALTPSADSKVGDPEVSVDFHLEFSEPNMDHAVEGIPSLTQRQLDSRFDVRVNELAILTTMVTLREGKASEGAAFFSQIPILGFLFSQNTRLKNDSELWFALRPSWDEIPYENAQKKSLNYYENL